MRRAHAQPARAARKKTTAHHHESARALPARVPREAAYLDACGSGPQGQTHKKKTAGGAAVFRRREEWCGGV